MKITEISLKNLNKVFNNSKTKCIKETIFSKILILIKTLIFSQICKKIIAQNLLI